MGIVEQRFTDRIDAGSKLANLVSQSVAAAAIDVSNVVVLGLPRGGVPVAAQVAAELRAPLDILVVRKIGLPAYPEVAVGAVGPGGVLWLDQEFIRSLGLSYASLTEVIARERAELERREQLYRAGKSPVPLVGRTVIVVDDGLATGSSMVAAIHALRNQQPKQVVVAVPVAAPNAVTKLRSQVDLVLSVFTPPWFRAVGQFYDDFHQTSDAEVQHYLTADTRGAAGPGATAAAGLNRGGGITGDGRIKAGTGLKFDTGDMLVGKPA